MYILALLPHSRTSRAGQIVPWHLVLFNRWFNTHRLFNWKWETSLSYDSSKGCFSFHAYWLKNIKSSNEEDSYYFKKWYLPWRKPTLK